MVNLPTEANSVEDLDAADGYQTARLCAINALAQVQKILLSLDVVAGIARLEGYLQTVAGFQEHAKVLDGASDLFHQVLGDGERTPELCLVLAVSRFVVTAQISRRQRWFWQWLTNSSRNKERAHI